MNQALSIHSKRNNLASRALRYRIAFLLVGEHTPNPLRTDPGDQADMRSATLA